MLEGKSAGPQGDLAIILRKTILLIPHKGQTFSGELGPDLMGAAGMEFNPDTGQIFCPIQHPILQNRFLDILARFCHNIGLALLLISKKQIPEFSVIVL